MKKKAKKGGNNGKGTCVCVTQKISFILMDLLVFVVNAHFVHPTFSSSLSPNKTDFGLRIIHVNDHHSNIEPDTFDIEIDSTFPESLQGLGEVSVHVGGWPLITAAIEEAVDEGYDMDYEVLKLHAGDAVTGTLFYSLFEGETDASYMNAVCFDAFALGNHEFDKGDEGLAKFLDFLDDKKNRKKCAKTPVLAANVVPGPNSPLVGRLLPYEIFEYKGLSVGVIGIDVRLKTLQSSFPDPETDLLDEVTVATAQIAALKAEGVEIIILLTHVGLEFDLSTLATLPGVDVVVGGDSHTFMGYTTPVAIEEKSYEYPGEFSSKGSDALSLPHSWRSDSLL